MTASVQGPADIIHRNDDHHHIVGKGLLSAHPVIDQLDTGIDTIGFTR